MKNVINDILPKKQFPQAMTAADSMLDARRRAAGSIANQPSLLDRALKRQMTTEWERHSGHFVSKKRPKKREGFDWEAWIRDYLFRLFGSSDPALGRSPNAEPLPREMWDAGVKAISGDWGSHSSPKTISVGDGCDLLPSRAASVTSTFGSSAGSKVDRDNHYGTARRMRRPALDADRTPSVCVTKEAIEALEQRLQSRAGAMLDVPADIPQLSEKTERTFRSIPTDFCSASGCSTLIHNFSK